MSPDSISLMGVNVRRLPKLKDDKNNINRVPYAPKDNPRVALWFHKCDESGVNSHPLEPISEDMESFLAMLTKDRTCE